MIEDDENFDIVQLIHKLKIDFKKSAEDYRFNTQLSVSVAQNEEDNWMSNQQDDLFYKVPNRIVSYIEGAVNRLEIIQIKF